MLCINITNARDKLATLYKLHMKNYFTVVVFVLLLSGFNTKTYRASELEYELTSMIQSFKSNANRDDCSNYLRKLDDLCDEIKVAKEGDEDGERQSLSRLEKKARDFFEFASTLTSCKGTSNELNITNFNAFLNETGITTTLVKENGCAAIYKANINGFQTYYAVNRSSKSKALKIVVPGATMTMNIMCNSVEGFSQGEPLRSISSVTISCTDPNLPCFN